MANTYKNSAKKINSTNETVVYSGVSNGTALIRSIYISNIHGSTSASINVYWNDNTDNEEYHIIKNVTIGTGTSMQPLTEPIVLEAGDTIKVQAGTADIFEVTVSVLEVT